MRGLGKASDGEGEGLEAITASLQRDGTVTSDADRGSKDAWAMRTRARPGGMAGSPEASRSVEEVRTRAASA